MVRTAGDETITLNNRVAIEVQTASWRVTRGYTFAAVLAEETAFWRDDTSANPDVEIFRAIRPGLSPEAVVADFAALLKTFRIYEVTGDRYGGEWPRERFRAHGIGYALSEAPKSDIYRDVLRLLNSRKTELLDLPRLATQLCGLERRPTRGGRESIDHAPGAHDDVANAVAGALLLVGLRKSLEVSDEVMAWLQSGRMAA